MLLLILLTSFILSLLISYFSIPFFSPYLVKRGLIGKDLNKEEEIYVPEMGGLIVFFSFALVSSLLSVLPLFYIFCFDFTQFLVSLLVLSFVFLVAVFDDLFSIRQIVKAILPILFSIPILLIVVPHPLDFHFFTIPFYFSYFLIPFGISAAANLSNVLAGYNGFETGIASIFLFFALLYSFINGYVVSSILLATYLGAHLALFNRHKYPASLFPGDIGTLLPGALLAISSILGGFEVFATFLMFPHILEFFVKLKAGLPSRIPNKINKGKLVPDKMVSTTQLLTNLLSKKGLEEYKLVNYYLIIYFVWALFVFIIFSLPSSLF